MISAEQIAELLNERRRDRSTVMERMRRVRDTYNGDEVVAVPEIDGLDDPAVANLVNLGLDGIAQRIASTVPNVFFPATGRDSTVQKQAARTRRDVVMSWWEQNNMASQLPRRARHYAGYAMTISQIRPNTLLECPEYRLRDPLSAYPAIPDGETMLVDDAIFCFQKNYASAKREFPGLQFEGMTPKPTDRVEMIEYVDRDEYVMLVVAARADYGQHEWGNVPEDEQEWFNRFAISVAQRTPNRLGRCPVVVNARFGLDRPVGQFDGMLAMYQQQALLMALELVAVKKGVFPDTWLQSSNEMLTPEIVREADGLRGVSGIVKGGTIQIINPQPGYMAPQTIDRLERNARVTAKIPAEFGGESSTNVRTGRRGDSIMSAVVDFPVQEAQRAQAVMLTRENELAIEVDKAYFDTSKTLWVSWAGPKEREITYVPSELFPSTRHNVSYAAPGSDANSLVIGLAQRVGTEEMSKRTMRALDPMIDDPDFEERQVIIERLINASLAGMEAQAQQGTIAFDDIDRTVELMQGGMDFVDAARKAQREAQERQAKAAEQASQMQPGMQAPGMSGIEQPPPEGTIPGLAEGASAVSQMYSQLRMPQMQLPAEMAG